MEDEISNGSSLVKKIGHNIKIVEIEKALTDHDHDKYITSPRIQ